MVPVRMSVPESAFPPDAEKLSFVLTGFDIDGEFEEFAAIRRELAAPLIGKRVTVAQIFDFGQEQGAYFIVAARALGIDCGPMSGFDKAKVNEALLAEKGWKANFLINLGHGDASAR